MTRVIIIVIFIFSASIANGQQFAIAPITQREVKGFLHSLNKKIEDTTRIDILIKLAEYYLLNRGTEGPDLDSTAAFISYAKEINAKQLSRKRDGIILLHEITLTLKRGDSTAAREIGKKAIQSLQAVNDDYHIVCVYLALSRCYQPNDPNQLSSVKDVFNAAFQHATKVKGEMQPGNTFAKLAAFYFESMTGDNRLTKLHFLERYADLGRVLNNKERELWARKEKADINYQMGNVDVAIRELSEVVKEQKAGGLPGICFTYDLLAGIYSSINNFDRSLYYSLETIKNVRTGTDSFYLYTFYKRVAENYSKTGSISEAVDWNLKRLTYENSIKRTAIIYYIVTDLTNELIKLGKTREALETILEYTRNIPPYDTYERNRMLMCLVQCYSATNNKGMARRYCEELINHLELQKKQNETTNDYGIDQFIALFFLNDGQYREAEKYFTKWWSPSKKSTGLFENSFLFKLDSARGNYLSAIQHLQAWQMKNDSIFTAKKSRQIEELKISYATEQKDSLITLKEDNIQLLTKQDQLQKGKLKQGTILRNISLAVVVLLIIIMTLLYNRYRLKQRTNRKLELQKSKIAKQNVSLQHLLTEKEWLLKEIHHRVKNNLQIVMSLLNSQSAFIDNESALTAIHDSQHRVHAMSLIHQKLYSTENVSFIDMALYIRELGSYLSECFDADRRIRFEYNIEPMQMDVSQAVPLGLILNEAITNSLKYAFPNDRNGVISVSLTHTSANDFILSIADNGVGMPANFKKTGSLGMSLMKGLSEDLDGNFSIERENGTAIKISFQHDPGTKNRDSLAALFISEN